MLLLTTAASFRPGPNSTLPAALAANFRLTPSLRFVFAVPVGWGLLYSPCVGGVARGQAGQPAAAARFSDFLPLTLAFTALWMGRL